MSRIRRSRDAGLRVRRHDAEILSFLSALSVLLSNKFFAGREEFLATEATRNHTEKGRRENNVPESASLPCRSVSLPWLNGFSSWLRLCRAKPSVVHYFRRSKITSVARNGCLPGGLEVRRRLDSVQRPETSAPLGWRNARPGPCRGSGARLAGTRRAGNAAGRKPGWPDLWLPGRRTHRVRLAAVGLAVCAELVVSRFAGVLAQRAHL